MSSSPLHELSALGQSVWIDNLSRASLRDGELERMTAPLEYRYHRDRIQLVSPSLAERASRE